MKESKRDIVKLNSMILQRGSFANLDENNNFPFGYLEFGTFFTSQNQERIKTSTTEGNEESPLEVCGLFLSHAFFVTQLFMIARANLL